MPDDTPPVDDAAPPPPDSTGSNFGPLDYLLKIGMQAHPAVRYAIAALALVAVGVIAVQITSPIAGDLGAFRMIIGLFLLVLVMMVLFFLFASFTDESNPLALWTGRILAVLFPIVLLGGVAWGAMAAVTESNCAIALLVKGPAATACDDKPPVIEGSVQNANDEQQFMENATVVIRHGKTLTTSTNENGDFTFDKLDKALVNQPIEAWARKAGFQRGPMQRLTLRPDRNLLVLKLNPETATAAARTSFAQSAIIPVPKINPARANEAVLVNNSGGLSDNLTMVRPSSHATAKLGTPWFDGGGVRFDIFYCQPPDGDARASKILATQLAQILRAQNNVGDVRVRLWPPRGTAGYRSANAAVVLNTRPERAAVSDALKSLWSPYLATGEQVADRAVKTVFPGYMSGVVCRTA